MEGCLALLLMGLKKQPRITSSAQPPPPTSAPETADMLPGSVLDGLWNIWVFLQVFPLTIEGCTQWCCSWRPQELPWACVGRSWCGLVFLCPVAVCCGLLRVAVAQPWGLEEVCGHLLGCGWGPVGWKGGMIRKFVKTTFVWLRLSRKRCSLHWFLLRPLDVASWDGLGWWRCEVIFV